MKHVVYKLLFDFEKEEKWINQMAAKGMNFVHYSIGRYLFEEGKSGEYSYRIELLKHYPSNPESIAYIRFMEDLGIECVATYAYWVYFRKKATEGPFDLFSDYESRILHYKRVSAITGLAFAVNIFCGLINIGISLFINNGEYSIGNLMAGIANLTVAAAVFPAFNSYFKKMKNLTRERQLHE